MVRISDEETAYRVLRAWELSRYIYYIQEYLPHFQKDIRAFVVGDRVVAAMLRVGRGFGGPAGQDRSHGRTQLAAPAGPAPLLEASARFLLSKDTISERVRKTSDAAWRLDWVDRHRDGVEVYYSFDVYHPSRGWALKPNLRDADPYGPDSLNSNSAGMMIRMTEDYCRRNWPFAGP